MKDSPRQWSSTLSWFLLALLVAAALLMLAWDPRAGGLALVTGKLVIGTLIIAVPVGTLLAALLTRTDLPGRGMFIGLWCWLLFLPLYVQVSAWDAGFGLQGWFTLATGQMKEPWLEGLRAAIWIHALAAIPWVMLIVGQGLRQVDPELEELALLDASAGRVFWSVTLVRAQPAIIAAALYVTVATAGEMTVTDVYRVRTYAEELYTNAALTTDVVELAIGIWPHVAIVSVLAILAWQAAAHLAPPNDRTPARRLWMVELGAARWPAFLMVMALTLLAVGIPVANLVYKAGYVADASASVVTWRWDRFVASTLPQQVNPLAWRFAAEYQSTLWLSVGVATCSTLLGIVLAAIARSGRRSTLAIGVSAMGLAIPGPLMALGVIWLLNRPAPALLPWLYDHTLFAPTLTVTLRALPITTLVMWTAFRSIDQDQIDVARVDGAGPTRLLWSILLPQRRASLAIAWLASLAIGAGDLAASLPVLPPGHATIANQIFILIHAGVHNAEAGLCLGQLALFAVIAAVVLAISARHDRVYER
jgi:iron(III) transport system permease protein